jgi:hypothetical protein
MAIDAGQLLFQFPSAGQATEVASQVVTNVTTTGDKVFFLATQPIDVYEVGAVIGTLTAATTYVFSVAANSVIGGAYPTIGQANFVTVTGPAGAAIAAGTTLKKSQMKIRVPKGGYLRFNVSGAPASGTACFYAIAVPAGAPFVGTTGGIATGAINEIQSTT